ncbi:MAG: hypothetical protein QXF75_06365 [Candidatus Bathyarchaeia archaeon]
MTKSEESISKGLDLSLKNPIIFMPALVPIVVGIIFTLLAYAFATTYYIGAKEFVVPNIYLSFGGSFIAYILGTVAGFMIVDMANDILNDRQADLTKSLNVIISRFGTLILATIIAAIFGITIVLLPIAFFLITIVIVDGLDAIESVKRSFDFVIKNIKEALIFILIVIIVQIIVSVVLSLIPIVGPLIATVVSWVLNVVFLASSVHFYRSLKELPPPPPPPPPLPPPPP